MVFGKTALVAWSAMRRLATSVVPAIKIQRLDHFVLTVRNIDSTVDFYTRVLGMEVTTFKVVPQLPRDRQWGHHGGQLGGRLALNFGQHKINLHQHGKEYEPKANSPVPGSADVCFITSTDINDVMEHLKKCQVAIVEGPCERTGALGPILSVYVRDPDHNLIEISNYPDNVR